MRALRVLEGMTPEEVRVLAVLGAGAFTLMSSLTSINIALPDIQKEFDISLSALKWVSIIGAISMASLSLSFGRVGDIVGRRRLYRAGMLIYAVGAGLAALALSFPHLMVMRILMTLGLAMANPLAAAILASTVAPERRGQALGLFASFQAAGQLTGPTMGGFILDFFDWRAIFITNMVLGLALVVAQQFLLKGVDERQPQRFDYWGSVLLLVGFPSLLVALSLGPGEGWGSSLTVFFFVTSALGLAGFILRESRFETPLFRLQFFASPPFAVAMFTLAAVSFIQNPITLFAPLYLRDVLSVGPLAIGVLMVSLPLSTLASGPLGGRLSDQYNPRVIASVGVLFALLGVLSYSQLGISSAAVLVIAPLILVGVGLGLSRPANQVAVYATVDRREFGSLSALIISLTTLSGALGSTITVAISEVRSTADTAASFTDAQQFTFLALVPLLLLALIVSLMGNAHRKTLAEKEVAVS